MTGNERLQQADATSARTALYRILAGFIDISAVWSMGHPAGGGPVAELRLLAFASRSVLDRLRAAERLHSRALEFLVVVDGDNFFSAWGPSARSGSLARSAWRRTSPREAFYDEVCWSPPEGSHGAVVRARRSALLLWPRDG